jgi:hypothetical protein
VENVQKPLEDQFTDSILNFVARLDNQNEARLRSSTYVDAQQKSAQCEFDTMNSVSSDNIRAAQAHNFGHPLSEPEPEPEPKPKDSGLPDNPFYNNWDSLTHKDRKKARRFIEKEMFTHPW